MSKVIKYQWDKEIFIVKYYLQKRFILTLNNVIYRHFFETISEPNSLHPNYLVKKTRTFDMLSFKYDHDIILYILVFNVCYNMLN